MNKFDEIYKKIISESNKSVIKEDAISDQENLAKAIEILQSCKKDLDERKKPNEIKKAIVEAMSYLFLIDL